MSRTIRITGKGTLHIKPDMTRLIIDLSGLKTEYDATLKRSADDTNCLRDALVKLGFQSTDLKTLSFDVDTKYENYRDKKDDWKQRFVGYEYSHRMKLEFPVDNDLLGKTLYALANAKVKPEFRISYFVRDEESAKNMLLGNAVSDAVAKAGVLSKAAGVTLGEILSIDYSWGKIDFEVHTISDEICGSYCASPKEKYELAIEPDDVNVSDTVTVIWGIG